MGQVCVSQKSNRLGQEEALYELSDPPICALEVEPLACTPLDGKRPNPCVGVEPSAHPFCALCCAVSGM
jgi:hypothetical protein